MVVLPTNTTTFCNRTGVDSSCYGPGAEAMGAHDTAIGVNSKADAIEGSTALGADSNASGNGSAAIGVNATSSGTGSIALGHNTRANGSQSFAIGADAVANGVGAIAIGPGARALGFNTNATAIGAGAIADGTSATSIGASAFSSGIDVTAVGAGARATHTGSTALGAGAVTTRDNQTVIGSASTELTVPSLAGAGSAIIAANQDGTLQRSSVSLTQVDNAVNKRLPKLERASRDLGQAVEAAGAMGAALSGLPEVSLSEDEPMRCGFGAGGWGSQYSVAGGCAARVADRLHVNGAIAYTPTVDYAFGSTPSVGGRVGFSFPLGKLNKPNQEIAKLDRSNQQAMAKLIDDRNEQINKLNQQLKKLQQSADSSEANQQLVALLKERIEQLESEKEDQAEEIKSLRSEFKKFKDKVMQMLQTDQQRAGQS